MSSRQCVRSFTWTLACFGAAIVMYSTFVWLPRIHNKNAEGTAPAFHRAAAKGAGQPSSKLGYDQRARQAGAVGPNDQKDALRQLFGAEAITDHEPNFDARLRKAVLALELLERGAQRSEQALASGPAAASSASALANGNGEPDLLDALDAESKAEFVKEEEVWAHGPDLSEKLAISPPAHTAAIAAPGAERGSAPRDSTPKLAPVRQKAKEKGHKKTIEEKIAMWRERDKFWLQQGAISSLLASKCIDTGNNRWNGELKLWGCHKNEIGPNQRFEFDKVSGIVTQPTGKGSTPPKCLDVRNDAPEGLKLGYKASPVLVACDAGSETQKWSFDVGAKLHKVWGRLRNKKTGECIMKFPDGRNTTHERSIVMAPCLNACNQTWSFGERPDNWPNEVARVRAPPKPTAKAGRILCWILTFPAAGDTKAAGVNNTWGRRCDTLLYMTTAHVEDLNTVELTLWGPEGRDKLWTKSKLAWLHVYTHYRDKADWFIKADDDTYIAMDNMREFLSQYNTMEPHHFGRKFSVYKDGYYSGGSGIVLSKEALIRMGEAFPTAESEGWAGAPRGTGPEDLLTSKSLKPLGVLAVEAVDKNDRQLFFPMGLEHEWFAPKRDEKAWFYRYSKVAKVGRECCSENWVAVHYTPTPKMYLIDSIEELQCEMPLNEWPHLELVPS